MSCLHQDYRCVLRLHKGYGKTVMYSVGIVHWLPALHCCAEPGLSYWTGPPNKRSQFDPELEPTRVTHFCSYMMVTECNFQTPAPRHVTCIIIIKPAQVNLHLAAMQSEYVSALDVV